MRLRQKINFPAAATPLLWMTLMERAVFYGVRVAIGVYMLHALSIPSREVLEIMAAFTALHFLAPMIGGWLGDHIYGTQRILFLSGVMMIVGLGMLALENHLFFFVGAGVLLLGSGMFYANVITLLGKVYPKENDNRDVGFTYFKMFSNLGVILGPIMGVLMVSLFGWVVFCILFMLVVVMCLISLTASRVSFGYHGLTPSSNFAAKFTGVQSRILFAAFMAIVIATFSFLLFDNEWVGVLVPSISLIGLFYLTSQYLAADQANALKGSLLLMVFYVGFLMTYFYAVSYASAFLEHHVEAPFVKHWGTGIFNAIEKYKDLTSAMLIILNGVFVVLLTPVFAGIWRRLGQKNKMPIAPVKVAWGLAFAGLGFSFLALSRYGLMGYGGLVPLVWVFVAFFFITVGEMLILPIVLAYVTRVTPHGMMGATVGFWVLLGALAVWLHKKMGRFFGTDLLSGKMCTIDQFCDTFSRMGWVALGLAVLLMLTIPMVRPWFSHSKKGR